ncbi:hypothetical protein [Oceanobacillus picturae]|uniref:hypothetical protein n=1 Tax=Oceanobacillus picturae TaxID=171693 RepID=UPI000E69DFF5|nr:hypothetical protein [Oceanobacillus picturae]RIU90173.1 hypothetical protein D1864_14080 [Oceanobacillus picturae]
MSHEVDSTEWEYPTVNVLHDQALVEEFIEGIGKNIFILTPSFPYVFIGKLVDVIEDQAVVDVKVTSISELENRQWYIHIHQIEVFYIQQKGQPRIPELRDDY